MNRSKLEKEAQLTAQTQSLQEQKEFATPEEMLRADAGQVEVPAQLLPRLRTTLATEGMTQKPFSWWQRLWGRPGQA